MRTRPVLWLSVIAFLLSGCGLFPSSTEDAALTLPAEATTLTSPDGELHISAWPTDLGQLRYIVYRGTADSPSIAIGESQLQIEFDSAKFVDGLTMAASEPSSSSYSFERPSGKARTASAEATTDTILVSNQEGQKIALDLVAFDDAVAHRFRVLGDSTWSVANDNTSVAFSVNSEKYVQAYDRVGQYTPGSEALYSGAVDVGLAFPAIDGWSFPALFHSEKQWTLVTEVGATAARDGSHLENEVGSAEHFWSSPPANQPEGPVDDEVAAGALPWKVFITSESLDQVVSSNAVEFLAPPSRLENMSWIRPGRVSWSWWSDSVSPTNEAKLRTFIDFAAEMGWEYSLIDANWNELGNDTIESLAAYASERGVGLFLWYNSGGPHNSVTEQPRDLMIDRTRRLEEMAWLQSIGIAGIKVDFFQSDKASMTAYALQILEDAADHELVVNFHGITSPKGWHVTYPNLLTTEAVRGAEQYKFDARFPAAAARHNTVLAFTRNVVGPMDYTPVTVSDSTFPHLTTFAHELALAVVFESGLQHLADAPASYSWLDNETTQYLQDLPVVWDEVRLLSGTPGSHVVIARRVGDDWWVAGINGTADPMTISIELDGAGELTLAVDGSIDRKFDLSTWDGDTIEIEMKPFGGFFAWPRN